MSFKAIFKIEDTEYNVLKCYYGLNQKTDPTGRPSSITQGGIITILIESTATTVFSDWMFNSFETKNGSIAFIKRDMDATLKELFFKEAYAIKYMEYFNSKGRRPMTCRLTISAREISIGDGEHINEWV